MEGVRGRRMVKQAKVLQEEAAEGNAETQISKKWTAEEREKLLRCLKMYGHKNVDKISEELPGRSKEDIRRFLIHIHALARQKSNQKSDVKYWLDKSNSEMEKNKHEKMGDYYLTAQVINYLSVDGLLENHPNVENCNGIDFSAAYRLIYQLLMGYPLQPVNQATADFIIETFTKIADCKKIDFVQNLTEFLRNKFKATTKEDVSAEEISSDNRGRKRSVYLKKRCAKDVPLSNEINAPPLKIFVQEGENTSSNAKCYSLAIGDSKDVSTVVVPVANETKQSELEETASKLWKNVEFNPFWIPDKWSRLSCHVDQ